ncbi:response regulator transcription factor [Chitinophaga barathri]|uniref:DNA-binding response regulator n=1 Tax=Chitinophaga barathri TaxID=1647451 RepID=A0A3N4MNF4_9BACT|nr:response regulator transcription factor [Chitinophaga barathri]RPD41169.1 DNA-binding response regulator [Chitinophaga barathri]
MKILIVEDELPLVESISTYLVKEHYSCEHAINYQQALNKVLVHEYDCILLDPDIQGGEGMQLLEALKDGNRQDGLIIIASGTEPEEKINALRAGADDYLSKPFQLPELEARIFSVIRRRQFRNHNVIRQNEIEIDLMTKTVAVHSFPLDFTKKEFELLSYLVGNSNRVVSKSALAEYLSGDIAGLLESHGFVYTHIKNVKKKLHEAGAGNYLKTVHGMGYKWETSG